MLSLAILLLLVAVGLLVAALVTGQTVLAWGSVGVSAVLVVALLVLAGRSRRRRRKAAETDPDAGMDDELDSVQLSSGPGSSSSGGPDPLRAALNDPDQDDADQDDAGQASSQPREPSSTSAAESEADGHPQGVEAVEVSEPGDDSEPDEEDTDAADLLVVWELPDEVLVVDEHPRYHLSRCTWPAGAATEPLPVQEARELGFTPCAQCRPDAALARRHRAALTRQAAGAGHEPETEDPMVGEGARSGGQDSDNSAVLG